MYLKKRYGIHDIFTIAIKANPKVAGFLIAERLVAALIPVIQVLIIADFLAIVGDHINDSASLRQMISPFMMLAFFQCYKWIMPKIFEIFHTKLENTLRADFTYQIVSQIATLKYRYLENDDTQDLIRRVEEGSEWQAKNQFVNGLNLIGLMIEVLGLILVIAHSVQWAALLIMVVAVPLFYLSMKSGTANYQAKREMSQIERKNSYFNEILQNRECVDERTLFGYSKPIINEYFKDYEHVRQYKNKVELFWYVKMKLGGILTVLLSTIIAFILVLPVLQGNMEVGLYMAIVNAVFGLVQTMSWDLADRLDQLASDKAYLKDLAEFSKLEGERDVSGLPTNEKLHFESLEFRNVSFKYPGTERYILKNLSFKIERGKHYSFVGENGSGKTTVTKLIMGLYDYDEGQILFNGMPYESLSFEKKIAISTIVFQDFSRYPLSLAENITIGHINQMGDIPIGPYLNLLGLDHVVAKLPQGIETNLGKIEDGVIDLSGGEWQKIAIARSMVSENEFMILDEPTAALDPVAETQIYELFSQISKKTTTLLISHRLGSTKLAHHIFVIKQGSIVEEGSHQALMQKGGLYQQMYVSQKQWYEEG